MLKLLPDLRIVEISRSIAPSYAGRLLADLGAEVIMLEDATQQSPRPDLEQTTNLADFLRANKRSATLDFGALGGDTVARAVCERADIVLYDGGVPYFDRMLLQERLYEQTDLVLCMITPWGLSSDTPYATLCSDELLYFALSGIASVTPEEPEDEANERPMQLYGHQSQFVAGLTAAAASLQAWYSAQSNGEAVLVDVPILDALTSMPIISQAAVFAGHPLPKGPSQRPQTVPRGFIRCREGYVYTQGGDDNWLGWARVVSRSDWGREPFTEPAYREQHWGELSAEIDRWLQDQDNADVYRALQREGVTAFPVNSIPQVTTNRQVVAREVFAPILREQGESFLAPRTPFRLLVPDAPPAPDVVHAADAGAFVAALGLDQARSQALRA